MATQYFGGNNLSAIGTITAIAVVLTSGISALFGNFTSVQSIYTSSTNMYAANIVATSSAILPSNTTINTKSVCLGDGSNCLFPSSTSTLQATTNQGATTTNLVYLQGGLIGSGSSTIPTLNSTYVTTSGLGATNICLTGDTCRTTWPSGGGSQSLAQTTVIGATSSQALTLYGGFTSAASTVTSTLAVQGTINATGFPGVSISNGGGNTSGLEITSLNSSLYGTIDWFNDAGAQAQMLMAGSAFSLGVFIPNSATFYNYSGSTMNLGTVSGAVNLFAGGYALTDIKLSIDAANITVKDSMIVDTNNAYNLGAFGSAFAGVFASSTSYFSNVSSSALTVDSKNVCLVDGTNCPAGSGSQTLAQVTALGSLSTTTLQLYGGFVGSSSTVTSTFTVLGGFNFADATGTNVTTTSLGSNVVSSTALLSYAATTSIFAVTNRLTAATTTMNGSFYSNTGTAALPSVSLKGDSDTGLYSAAANQLGVTAGGSASLLVSASAVSAGSNNTRTLGTQAIQWTTIFGTSVSSTYSTATVAVIGSSLYPSANNAASIGTNVRAFANIFASGTINGVNVTSTGAAIDFPGIGAPGATSDLVCWTAVTGRLTHQATSCTVSSIRFKEHVTGLKPSDMMDIARKLRAVQYTTKDDGKAQQGFIAEEVAMVDPFLVVWEETTPETKAEVLANYPNFEFLLKNGKEFTPRTVDYARVSVVLSGAVNDLDRRLTELEKRVSFLEYLWNAVRSLFK